MAFHHLDLERQGAGLAAEEIVIPAGVQGLAAGVYTELQPGSYAVMDVEYGDLGDLPFAPALFLAASDAGLVIRRRVSAAAVPVYIDL